MTASRMPVTSVGVRSRRREGRANKNRAHRRAKQANDDTGVTGDTSARGGCCTLRAIISARIGPLIFAATVRRVKNANATRRARYRVSFGEYSERIPLRRDRVNAGNIPIRFDVLRINVQPHIYRDGIKFPRANFTPQVSLPSANAIATVTNVAAVSDVSF